MAKTFNRDEEVTGGYFKKIYNSNFQRGWLLTVIPKADIQQDFFFLTFKDEVSTVLDKNYGFSVLYNKNVFPN